MNLYEGMGSLNDIVLQKGGPLLKENNEFYRLKHELHEKCIEMRTSKFQSTNHGI